MKILALLIALASAEPTAPAAGVLVSVKAPVRVERSGAAVPAAELGMRLMKGDVVVVGSGGAAMLYLAGGGIERVPAGGRFAIPAPTKAPSGAMKSSESGLWVLNDPSGSVLVAAMRGNDGAFADVSEARADLLSPRYETIAERRPRFFATGGTRPSRIAVAAGKEVLWHSGSLEGDGPWAPEGFPDLDAAKVYLWRIESAEGEPQSEWVPFRVSTPADAEAAAAFEKEMATLAASSDGAAAADVLRCGRYLDRSSWTALLSASTRLLALQPDSTVAQRARESAVRGLRLEAERAESLIRLLSP
ncbi:MAG TPA: hypothetical protein VJ826_04695 [Candidatus Polarisedimenticolaceae bacterium]|nr:hypothetical protein [Candidatus Polarisedimenticolaceae bacterium]